MRISDWSSDVCSSDLCLPSSAPFSGSTPAFRVVPARRPAFLLSGQHTGGARRLAMANFQFRTFPNKSLESEDITAGRTAVFRHIVRRKTVENENGRYAQIGRTTLRERELQYV